MIKIIQFALEIFRTRLKIIAGYFFENNQLQVMICLQEFALKNSECFEEQFFEHMTPSKNMLPS